MGAGKLICTLLRARRRRARDCAAERWDAPAGVSRVPRPHRPGQGLGRAARERAGLEAGERALVAAAIRRHVGGRHQRANRRSSLGGVRRTPAYGGRSQIPTSPGLSASSVSTCRRPATALRGLWSRGQPTVTTHTSLLNPPAGGSRATAHMNAVGGPGRGVTAGTHSYTETLWPLESFAVAFKSVGDGSRRTVG